MQSQTRLLDDLARVASSAFGVATGMRSEVEARMRDQFERVIQQMDLVTREEHEVVLSMAQKAREEQEAMADRLEQLEARLAKLEQGGGSTAKAKSGAGGKSATSKSSSGSSSKKS